MNKDYCDITLLIDKSGSMESLKQDTIGGINSFLDEQKKIKGKCRVSLYQFDDFYETTYENADIGIAPKLDDDSYRTRGWTALLDAIGKTINNVGSRLSKMEPEDRPSKVIIVIQSDGQENRSKKFSKSEILEMIKHQQSKYSWNFLFLGANMDAVSTGVSYGLIAANTMTYKSTARGTHNMYKSTSDNISSYRISSDSSDLSFKKKDRDAQENS